MVSNNLAVLGSTGSIGIQTLRVAKRLGLNIVALSCDRDVAALEIQARMAMPDVVAIRDETRYNDLKIALSDTNIKIVAGENAASQVADYEKADVVVNSIVGIAGLNPTLTALRRGVRLALANKESLVAAGELVMKIMREYKAQILPVDSEHSAIYQCLNGEYDNTVKRIILTASGGPFFGKTRSDLRDVSVAEALKHPNWKMGKKISIDSATMMNKGLELIEAMHLFNMQADQIEVLVHRQSIVHSAVEFADGAVMAQLGIADMEIPIQYALTWPNRHKTDGSPLSLLKAGALTFEPPDREVFTCLTSAEKAAHMKGLAPCVLNGANEAAVGAFLKGKISFLKIGDLVTEALEEKAIYEGDVTVESVMEADRRAREFVFSRLT